MRPGDLNDHRSYLIIDGDKRASIEVNGSGTTGVILNSGPFSFFSISRSTAAEMLVYARVMGYSVERRSVSKVQRAAQFQEFCRAVASGITPFQALINAVSAADDQPTPPTARADAAGGG
jgi:hypothetical protein